MIMADGRGVITLVNSQAERLFGYLRTEMLGKPVEMLIPERFRNAQRGSRNGFFAHPDRSEEHTSELQSLMRISYAVFRLKKKMSISSKTPVYMTYIIIIIYNNNNAHHQNINRIPYSI